MQRLKSRAQFQAVLAATTVARSGHFVLHRLELPVNLPQVSVSGHNLPTALPQQRVVLGPAPESARLLPPPLFGTSGIWLGAMVPKRWAKRAVTRNMIKRRIYSLAQTASACDAMGKADAAYVVRLRSAFDPRLFKSASSAPLRLAVCQELSSLFAQGFQRD
jgi:ribonuclease P protein component